MYSLIISFIVANCVLTVFNKDNDDSNKLYNILATVGCKLHQITYITYVSPITYTE